MRSTTKNIFLRAVSPRHGFTLVELLMVIAVIAVLGSLAVGPSPQREKTPQLQERNRLSIAANRF
ncbi:MAG: prepilin-type N-terminal cleavage/methylation domain-containing protein [Pirellulaceae bacterium]